MRQLERTVLFLYAILWCPEVDAFSWYTRSCHANKRSQLAHRASNKNTSTGATHNVPDEEEVWDALERLETLDNRLGVGMGANKERAKLNALIEAWETQQQQQAIDEAESYENIGRFGTENADHDKDLDVTDGIKFVVKHRPNDRIAFLGGDPARRRRAVEKKLAPFGSLDQFGSPHDVGHGDTTRLLKKIASHKYDVVYVWTRFNSHNSRQKVRDACCQTGTTRFEEIESLSYIR